MWNEILVTVHLRIVVGEGKEIEITVSLTIKIKLLYYSYLCKIEYLNNVSFTIIGSLHANLP
jgi:hypothetical protein